jgi:exodeoxyribonuclease V alpha subunit
MIDTLSSLKQLALANKIRHIDYYFAEFILRLERKHSKKQNSNSTHTIDPYTQHILLLSACLVNFQQGQGDVCVLLSHYTGQILFDSNQFLENKIMAPKLSDWRLHLNHCHTIGQPHDSTPLILSPNGRLYLTKYFHYEHTLAQYLINQSHLTSIIHQHSLTTQLNALFPMSQSTTDFIDWQKISAILAIYKPFCVISGGPGTGKTTTITKILALLIKQQLPNTLRIALAAPTGKAAARLTESLMNAKQNLHFSTEINNQLPEQCSTIHRLLGSNSANSGYRHNAQNPLHYDILVIDEASMIDLSLMYHLTQALLTTTRVILLGDKDQLASVESGSILGDICDFHQNYYSKHLTTLINTISNTALTIPRIKKLSNPPLMDNISILRTSYRFDQYSGIGELAKQVNQGDYQAVNTLLEQRQYSDIQWYETISDRLSAFVIQYYSDFLTANNALDALIKFNHCQVLCAVRKGYFGVEKINRYIEKVMYQQQLINNDAYFYAGRPIMITHNDYNQQLFNGDIGIVFPDKEENNQLRVFFLSGDQQLKKVLPQRLPAHETVFAMTIHKSQGSEFDHLLMILSDQDSPILTRELIYTGITRARKTCTLIAPKNILKQAITRQIQRTSGLKEKLSELLPSSIK